MKLKKYINKLNNLLKEHGDLEIIYSHDDVGNRFQSPNFGPSVVYTDSKVIEGDYIDNVIEKIEDEDINKYQKVICIN